MQLNEELFHVGTLVLTISDNRSGTLPAKGFVMPSKNYTIDEKGDLAEKIYQEQIKALVEPQENGKFIAIDIESGDYEIAEELIVASHQLRDRRPESIRFGTRIGYPSAYRIGWRGQTQDY